MPKFKRVSMIAHVAVLLLTLLLVAASAGLAYTSAARSNLLKTRDALIDQRAQLERANGDIDSKIRDLQKQQDTLTVYLRDLDRSIKEIDVVLNAQDRAVRDF